MRRIAATAALVIASTAGVLAQSTTPTTVAVVAQRSADAAPAVPAPVIQGYTYKANGRRDPFVSLLRRGADSDPNSSGPRAAGLAGMSSGEITLKGIVAGRGGYVALVRGVDSKTYIVHPGEKLLDGTIQGIAADSMVILQQVNDPLSRQKQREIRKVLRQTEEAK